MQKNFTPVMPPQLKANRSVLIFKVENHIFKNSEEDIKEEILKHNEWVEEISQVYKFPNTNTLKISFTESNKATKAQEYGIKLFFMKIANYNIVQDTYVNITTCMKCYAIEEHTTRQCPKEASYKICSCCSATDHTWTECKAGVKSCINCGGDHVTVAMQCPKRKEAINTKRKEAKEIKTNIYSSVTKQAHTPQTINIPNSEVSIMQAKTYSCMLYAMFLDSTNPGTFQEELNELFEKNDLPKIKITKNPPSNIILGLTKKISPNIAEEEKQEKEAVGKEQEASKKTSISKVKEQKTKLDESQQKQELKSTEQKPKSKTRSKSESKTHEEEDKLPDLIPAEALGIQLISKKSKGWPPNLSLEEIVTGLENQTYKCTHTKEDIPDEMVYKMIANNEIRLKSCWSVIEDSSFSTVKNGLVEDCATPGKPAKSKPKSK